MRNGFSHLYSLPILGLLSGIFSILFKFKKNILRANSGDPDQTPRYVASDLGLQYLSVSHKKDARLIWVNKSAHLRINLQIF